MCASVPVVANRSQSEARTQLSQQPLLKGSSAFETGTLTHTLSHCVCRAQATPPLWLPRPLPRSAGRLSDSFGLNNVFALFLLFFLPLEQFCPLSLILNAQCALLGVDADADADVNANAGSAVSNKRRRRRRHAHTQFA